jgi:F0F1-type ATP synthase epsilon subunit
VRGCATLARHGSEARLQQELEEAERKLDAAKRLSEVRAAARKLQRARAELGWLEAEERPKPP